MRARRWWGWPLAPIYAAGLALRDGLRRLGVLRVRRLRWPVISVGSLSAGGAGKTPVVIALAELLRARGWDVDVLSRGYGRKGRGVERVDLDAVDAAARFGDEPVVIAQKLQSKGCADASHPSRKERGMDVAPDSVVVWVGAERFAAGEAAEGFAASGGEQQQGQKRNAGILPLHCVQGQNDNSEFANDKPRAHLLDDGFQHWGLARAVDVVLVTEEDLEEALLPAGNRREPLAALGRADVVVLRDTERARVETRVRELMRAGAAVWSVRRDLRFADCEGSGSAGTRPLAFCAIARPDGFWAMLEESGCQLAEIVAFGDHHAYAMVDMVRMVAMAKKCGATGFVTTEKDAVKLTEAMMERLREVGPVCVAVLTARFVDEADVVRELEECCR